MRRRSSGDSTSGRSCSTRVSGVAETIGTFAPRAAALRSTAASIYNWGRIVSFTAPLITAQIAGKLGLGAAMATAAVSFLLAAMIWFSLPETVRPQVSRRT